MGLNFDSIFVKSILSVLFFCFLRLPNIHRFCLYQAAVMYFLVQKRFCFFRIMLCIVFLILVVKIFRSSVIRLNSTSHNNIIKIFYRTNLLRRTIFLVLIDRFRGCDIFSLFFLSIFFIIFRVSIMYKASIVFFFLWRTPLYWYEISMQSTTSSFCY